MADPVNLFGIDDYGKALVQKQLEANMVAFFDWGFLEAGAFHNFQIPSSGFYGGDFHNLQPADDSGLVWQGARSNWVWESGLYYSQVDPIALSGIYVNSTYYPNTTVGASGYSVNYPDGTITFNSAQSGVVQAGHSSKHIFVGALESNPVYRNLVYGSLKVNQSEYDVVGSGIYNTPSRNRVQLPAVLVKCLPREKQRGFQLGGGQIVWHPIHFYVIAENNNDLSQITDAVMNQAERVVKLFDVNKITYPALEFDGNIGSGTVTYPDMITESVSGSYSTYWRKLRFNKSHRYMYNSEQNLYQAIVVLDSELDMPDLI